MTRWALRTLVAEPMMVLASTLGLAGALFLVLLLEGLFVGISDDIVRYLERSDAEVWVMGKRVENMHMATSFVSSGSINAVRDVAGVADVTPILYLNTMVEAGKGERWFAYVVGGAPDAPRGGPWAMREGRHVQRPGEAVIPWVLAARGHTGLGGDLVVAGHRYSVVGLSDETFSMANSVVFLHWDDVAELTGQQSGASYLLVKAVGGASGRALAARIVEQVGDVAAFDKDTFVASDRALAMHMGAELIAIMTMVGASVGILIVGWTVFLLVTRRRRELAVAKALGASNRSVVAAVVLQAVVLTCAGYAVALALAFPFQRLVAHAVPEVTILFVPATLLRVGVVAILVASIAAAIPARRVVRVDPASVFT